ncbi:MAG: MMPL family transporter [Thermoanaerobaculia bacterium]
MIPPSRWPFLLSRAAIRNPIQAIVLMSALALLAAPGVLRLKIRTDGHALVPPDDPVVAIDAEVRRHFGLEDPIVVIVESRRPEGIYNPATLGIVARVTELAQALPGVKKEDVVSLATEHRDRVYPGTLNFRPYLDPLPRSGDPETPQELATLKGDLDAAQILYGTLVSGDAKSAAILIGVPNEPDFDRSGLYRRILEQVRPLEDADNHLSVVGAPVAEALLGDHIFEDLLLLLPLSFAVIAVVIWLGCRRVTPLLLASFEITACQLFTVGVMGWAGSPVYLTTAILPVIMTTICLADEIHIYWRYQQKLAEAGTGTAPRQLVEDTLEEIARPIALTSLTTAVGFFSFLGSSIHAVQGFGVFAALGILFSMVWTMTVVPAFLVLISPQRFRHPRPQRQHFRPWITPLMRLPVRRPGATLGAVAALTLLLGVALPRLVIQDSWIDGFAPASEFRRATDHANQTFNGTHLLLLALTFDPPASEVPEVNGLKGPFFNPKLLETIGELEAFVRAQPGVGGVLGPHSQVTTVSYLWLARRPDSRAIPKNPERVALVFDRFETGRGIERRREVVDDDFRRGVVTVFLKDANYQDTARLMGAVRAFAAAKLGSLGGRLDFAGDVAVSQAMIPAIVRTQVASILLAPLTCWLTISLLFRSAKTGLLAVLPASLAVVWVFGLMGWLAIPLGVATSMFCAIAIGIGVDYGIHFLERYSVEKRAAGGSAVAAALEETGPPILSDTLAITLGFAVLALSQVPANARFGLLVGASLVAGSVLTLFGLGACLELVERRERHKVPAPAGVAQEAPAASGGSQ